MNDDKNKPWLVRRRTIRLLWWVGGLVLAAITVGDLGAHGYTGFVIDGSFAFYSWFGLASCVAMVLFAKGLGAFLKRSDDYYDG